MLELLPIHQSRICYHNSGFPFQLSPYTSTLNEFYYFIHLIELSKLWEQSTPRNHEKAMLDVIQLPASFKERNKSVVHVLVEASCRATCVYILFPKCLFGKCNFPCNFSVLLWHNILYLVCEGSKISLVCIFSWTSCKICSLIVTKEV